jgi:hypothetical protein
MSEKFTEEEKDAARALLAALEPFRAMRPTIPLQYVHLFLNIVLEEVSLSPNTRETLALHRL